MFPVLLELGPIKLHTYGLMIALGFLVSLYFMKRDAKRVGVDPDAVTEIAFWSLFIGILGTRVLHIIMYPENYSWSNPLGWIAIWQGGLVFQGAIPSVLLYVWYALRKRNIPFWIAPDFVMPWVPLAQAFGRMGCFFNGCCFGQRADNLPWGICFPEGSPPYAAHTHFPDFILGQQTTSFPVHPTQLYSVVLLVTICLTMFLMRRYWNPFTGFTLPMYLMLYGIIRFIVEMFRGDGNPTNLSMGFLSNQQVFCIFMFLLGAVLFAYLYRNPPKIVMPAKPQDADPVK